MRTSKQCRSTTGVVLCVLSAFILGCASGGSETYSGRSSSTSAGSQQVTQSASNAGNETPFAGVWQGTTLASCAAFAHLPSRCDAEQNVTITLLEGPNGKFSGRYTCAYGNQDCYQENTTGKVIDVTLAGERMNVRVIMPDATSCIYTGLNVNEAIKGGYTCYEGGGLIEEGSWQARRSY